MTVEVLVDTNVLLDVLTEDPVWFDWSSMALAEATESALLRIDPLIYAEVSVRFSRIEDLEEALRRTLRDAPVSRGLAGRSGRSAREHRALVVE